MTRPRKHIPLKVQVAALILHIDRLQDLLLGHRHVSYEESKILTPEEIRSLGQLHHYPYEHTIDGPDEPWNLQWEWNADHKVETARLAKARTKVKRIRKQLVGGGRGSSIVSRTRRPPPKHKWPKRRIPSRPFRRKGQ